MTDRDWDWDWKWNTTQSTLYSLHSTPQWPQTDKLQVNECDKITNNWLKLTVTHSTHFQSLTDRVWSELVKWTTRTTTSSSTNYVLLLVLDLVLPY